MSSTIAFSSVTQFQGDQAAGEAFSENTVLVVVSLRLLLIGDAAPEWEYRRVITPRRIQPQKTSVPPCLLSAKEKV